MCVNTLQSASCFVIISLNPLPVKLINLLLKYTKGMASSFKENLKQLLEYKEMTVKELSRLTGISDRSLGNYLNSRESMPPADYACRIAKAMNTTVEFLVTGENLRAVNLDLNSQKMLTAFSKLSKTDQEFFLRLIKGMSKI